MEQLTPEVRNQKQQQNKIKMYYARSSDWVSDWLIDWPKDNQVLSEATQLHIKRRLPRRSASLSALLLCIKIVLVVTHITASHESDKDYADIKDICIQRPSIQRLIRFI